MNRRELLALPGLIALGSHGPGASAQAQALVRTRVDTALGAFVIAVDPQVAPITVANYLAYADARDRSAPPRGHGLDGPQRTGYGGLGILHLHR